MEDRFVKYSKLYAIIFLMFLAVPVLLGVIVAAFYGISKLVSSSYVDVIFGLGVITLAPALFSAVYVIYFKRTKRHPVSAVRLISQALFVAGIVINIAVLIIDMISFFNKYTLEITGYKCFTLAYLAGNVGGLFLIAIIQAFTTKKEVDWMQRNT